MHLQNSLTKRNFKAGSWISKLRFAQKRRISRSYCSGSWDRSNQLAERPHQSEINYEKRFLWFWRIRFWWWQQNWNGATILFIWSTKLPSVEPWQAKGRTILTRSGRLKNVFSGRQLGLVQEETLVVFYTRMPRETVRTTWNEVEIRKKSSPGASILFSTESEETDWRKSLNSLKASPATKAKKSLSMVGKTKNIAMRLSTSSRVSWLQVWKQMRSWLTLPYFDKLMVRTTSRRRYSRSSCRSREKKRPRLCISKIKRQWLLFYGKLKN